jgi:peptidoglycan/xylan/chitin deacetylase (PgdA/CDA1 family)
MSLMHSLLAAAYPPLRLGNNLLRRVGAKSDARLRVLICHAIVPQEQDRFAAQLRWLARLWAFVSPQRFAAMMRGDEPIKGANLLLTFDDGFASNRRVANEILNPMGIQALFFAVSDFMDLAAEDDYRAFIARHIWPLLTPAAVPDHWRNMTWNDLSWLLETGHTIGAHTRTHARLSELKQENELEAEIVESANALERNLGVKIEHFAYPFGNLASFSPEALTQARRRFNFIYTGMRGDNARGVPSCALRRDAIFPANSFGLIGALLEGGADISYARDLAQYESWVSNK